MGSTANCTTHGSAPKTSRLRLPEPRPHRPNDQPLQPRLAEGSSGCAKLADVGEIEPDTDAAEHGREISAVARLAPGRRAIASEHGDLTFAELDRDAERLAGYLQNAGLAAGDVVALLCTNRPEWIVAQQAALRSGLRLVPVNWHLKGDDIAYVIADSGAQVLITEDTFVSELSVNEVSVSELSDEVRDITTRVVIGDNAESFTSFAEAVSEPLPTDPERLRGSLMIYTSGSTGRPKGVRQADGSTSSGAAIGAAMVAMFGLDGDRGDQMLCPAPLYHSGPSRICSEWPLGAGVTVHLMARFDAEAALELIDRQRLTHAFFVPTMFHRMLEVGDRDRYDLSSLRFVLHGAGPCNAAIKAQMFDWLGPIIHEMYAATEGPGTWIRPQEWLEHPGSVGRTDPTRLQIRLDDGEVAEPLQDGTVWSRATTPFHYHDDPHKTAATFDPSGEWYTVGDRGYIGADGYLYLTGRTAECIVSGGVNLYPARVDEALLGHRGVSDGAAFALDDVEFGQVMAAAIIPVEEASTDDLIESVISHCQETIGSQLTPRHVFIVDELPRTEAGKLYRHRLTEQFSNRSG